MPRRGNHPLGTQTYASCRDLVDMMMFTNNRYDKSLPFRDEDEMERYISRKVKDGCSVDANTLRGLMLGRISWDGLTNKRVVEGTAFTPNNSFEGHPILTETVPPDDFMRLERQSEIKLKSGGAMSLDDTALIAGDFIKYLYDFGDENT
jgi:hypothetical protein